MTRAANVTPFLQHPTSLTHVPFVAHPVCCSTSLCCRSCGRRSALGAHSAPVTSSMFHTLCFPPQPPLVRAIPGVFPHAWVPPGIAHSGPAPPAGGGAQVRRPVGGAVAGSPSPRWHRPVLQGRGRE